MSQTYRNVEVIVIDDGSTDDTKSVVPDNGLVKYFYQPNKGLSASRNTGIEKARGAYLVFLDADDWLEKDALEQNYNAIKDKPTIAFVSGNYNFLRAETGISNPVITSVFQNHYTRLLQANYIGMHAAVMFQRWVFTYIRYDERLQSCEDYDLYLRIARHYPVIHHQPLIATYFFHSSGLSHNYEVMMNSITTVIEKQAPFLQSEEEKKAYEKGLEQWKEYHQMLEESL